jgi:hypothetical protein
MGRFCGLIAAVILSGGAAYAQFSVTIQFNEDGTGLISNTAGFSSSLPSGFVNDPGPGGFNNALFFSMLNPPGLVAGDLLLTNGATVSDVIRFDPLTVFGGGAGGAFFYSLPGGGQLADIGLPASYLSNMFSIAEAVGGPTSYTPIAGQPGFVSGAAGPVTYQITSGGAVPEPGTWLLLGSAMVVLMARRQARASLPR